MTEETKTCEVCGAELLRKKVRQPGEYREPPRLCVKHLRARNKLIKHERAKYRHQWKKRMAELAAIE